MQTENLFTTNCIRTFTGKYFNILEPNEDMVCIEDIAHSLSMQCRFGGHLPKFYSVAQHSIEVCETTEISSPYRLSALMHDASEAYLLDIPRPAKILIPNYKTIEDKIMNVIASKFGFEWPAPAIVKYCDEKQLKYEWEEIFLKQIGYRMPQKEAEQKFLIWFKAYYKP